MFSVHASPRRVDPGDLRRWRGVLPDCRLAAEGILLELRCVDLVIAMLASTADFAPILAAGDFNEARQRARGAAAFSEWLRFGQDLFDRIASHGFVDVTYRDWREERPTLFNPRLAPFQSDDHVLATADVAAVIHSSIVDRHWSDNLTLRQSDHALIWFKFGLA